MRWYRHEFFLSMLTLTIISVAIVAGLTLCYIKSCDFDIKMAELGYHQEQSLGSPRILWLPNEKRDQIKPQGLMWTEKEK